MVFLCFPLEDAAQNTVFIVSLICVAFYSGRWCWAHSFSICRKFVVSTVFASKEQTSKRLNLLRLRCLYNNFGGDGEDRTPDLCNANATLSQLSYAPICRLIVAQKNNDNPLFGKKYSQLKGFVVGFLRKLSSAGEHSLHRGGVAGSNPAVSTTQGLPISASPFLSFQLG